jgi:hypothetical protein
LALLLSVSSAAYTPAISLELAYMSAVAYEPVN